MIGRSLRPMVPAAFNPVRRLLDERTPIPVIIRDVIDRAAKDWIPDRRLAGSPPEPPPDWATLKRLDFDGEFLRMSQWVYDTLTREPFPAEVNGLWFGFLIPPPRNTVALPAVSPRSKTLKQPVRGCEIFFERLRLDFAAEADRCAADLIS